MTSWRLPGLRRGRRPRIFLHIGASKTGTTYLQDLMAMNRRDLAEAGCLVPGGARLAQVNAVLEAMRVLRRPDSDVLAEAPRWAALVEEAVGFRGRSVVISSEYLSFLDEDRARRLLATFGDADVHVILTLRDARSTLPGQWQTSIRNGGRLSFDRYQRGLARSLRVRAHELRQLRPQRIFQRSQGVPRMLDVWLPLVGAERLHLVTVPPSGSDPTALWKRFASVVRVRATACSRLPAKSNVSLGYPSVEFLRRVNLNLDDLDKTTYFRLVRGFLARRVLEHRAPLERRAALDATGMRRAARWNRAITAAIEERGLTVVGALADLPPVPAQAPETIPAPSPAELLAAAASCRAGLSLLLDHLAGGAGNVRMTLTPAQVLADAPVEDDGTATADAVDKAADEIAALIRDCAAVF